MSLIVDKVTLIGETIVNAWITGIHEEHGYEYAQAIVNGRLIEVSRCVLDGIVDEWNELYTEE